MLDTLSYCVITGGRGTGRVPYQLTAGIRKGNKTMGKTWTDEERILAREWGEKGGRPARSNAKEPKVPGHGMEVQRLKVGYAQYVQTYIRCGKKCERCRPGGSLYQAGRPGHGPYWYRFFDDGKKVRRRYIGKVLKVIEGRGGEEHEAE